MMGIGGKNMGRDGYIREIAVYDGYWREEHG